MSNVIDLLLNADLEQIERPSKEVEIKRLSNALGEKFTVLCKALSYDKYSEIQEDCIDMRTKEPTFDLQKLQIELVLNGVFNAQDGTRFFSNKDLHKTVNFSPNILDNLFISTSLTGLSICSKSAFKSKSIILLIV